MCMIGDFSFKAIKGINDIATGLIIPVIVLDSTYLFSL